MLDIIKIWVQKNENGDIEIIEPPNPKPSMKVIRRYDSPINMNISVGSKEDDARNLPTQRS